MAGRRRNRDGSCESTAPNCGAVSHFPRDMRGLVHISTSQRKTEAVDHGHATAWKRMAFDLGHKLWCDGCQ